MFSGGASNDPPGVEVTHIREKTRSARWNSDTWNFPDPTGISSHQEACENLYGIRESSQRAFPRRGTEGVCAERGTGEQCLVLLG